jgi:hypothetical protein
MDTSPEAWERYFELLRATSPARRLETAFAHSDALRSLALAGIRAADPAASGEAVRQRLAERLYGAAAAGAFEGLESGTA